jgi:hypothetical protein
VTRTLRALRAQDAGQTNRANSCILRDSTAQLASIKPHLQARSAQRFSDATRGVGVLRGLGEKDGLGHFGA